MQTVQTVLLNPDTHLRIRYPVPRNGLIEYTVEADGATVDTYVLDKEGLEEFNKGGEISSCYGGFTHRYEHYQELRLPFRGWWYLLIVNRSTQPVAVHYDVSG